MIYRQTATPILIPTTFLKQKRQRFIAFLWFCEKCATRARSWFFCRIHVLGLDLTIPMLESYFSSPERSKVIKNDSVYKGFPVGRPRALFLYQKCVFDIKIIFFFVKTCTLWCQGPVKVPRSDRRCFWTRKTNGLRQPQMLEFRDFSVPAALFLRFSENWTSLSKKCIQIPSFGPARPQRAKHCITNAFLYTFRGVWRHRADFHKNAFFRKLESQ